METNKDKSPKSFDALKEYQRNNKIIIWGGCILPLIIVAVGLLLIFLGYEMGILLYTGLIIFGLSLFLYTVLNLNTALKSQRK